MILIAKDAWINQNHITKIKKDENGMVYIFMSNGVREILDIKVLSLENLLYMLEGG